MGTVPGVHRTHPPMGCRSERIIDGAGGRRSVGNGQHHLFQARGLGGMAEPGGYAVLHGAQPAAKGAAVWGELVCGDPEIQDHEEGKLSLPASRSIIAGHRLLRGSGCASAHAYFDAQRNSDTNSNIHSETHRHFHSYPNSGSDEDTDADTQACRDHRLFHRQRALCSGCAPLRGTGDAVRGCISK